MHSGRTIGPIRPRRKSALEMAIAVNRVAEALRGMPPDAVAFAAANFIVCNALYLYPHHDEAEAIQLAMQGATDEAHAWTEQLGRLFPEAS
jgi:hypothetical protein